MEPVTENEKEPTKVKNEEEKKEPEFLTFTRAMHSAGAVDKSQVDAMELFADGKMDYGTMRSLCG